MMRNKSKKFRNYWNERTIINELKALILETKYFPSADELRKMKRNDLVSAMRKHGGLNYFRRKLGYELLIHVPGHWNEETITNELKAIIKKLSHFPTSNELSKMKKANLSQVIAKHGGTNHFRELLGYEILQKSCGYWTEENTIKELKLVIKELSHFPINDDLKKMKRHDLLCAISKHGGINHFRELLGYKILQKSKDYWTEEIVIKELERAIKELNHFPATAELEKMNMGNLTAQISKYGGVNYFRGKLKYEILRKSKGYWTEEMILLELNQIVEDLDHFPTTNELYETKRYELLKAISKCGGLNYFRNLMKYEILRNSPGYWTDENVIAELKSIIKEIGHFPTRLELINMNKENLSAAISRHGGFEYFWNIFGISPAQKQKIQSEIASYINSRGFNSERIVKELLIKWCYAHNLPQPDFNVKLSKGNVIEFVCESNLKIGIDVTNTKASKNAAYTTISRKWKHKQYHLHLDELWIVVFSDVLNDSDYIKFNTKSPENVKVMSVNTFMEELNITIDDSLQLKIDNYNTCTFHNKDDFSHPKVGLSKFFKIRPDIRVKN